MLSKYVPPELYCGCNVTSRFLNVPWLSAHSGDLSVGKLWDEIYDTSIRRTFREHEIWWLTFDMDRSYTRYTTVHRNLMAWIEWGKTDTMILKLFADQMDTAHDAIIKSLACQYKVVEVIKPSNSNIRSMEFYVVATGLRDSPIVPETLSAAQIVSKLLVTLRSWTDEEQREIIFKNIKKDSGYNFCRTMFEPSPDIDQIPELRGIKPVFNLVKYLLHMFVGQYNSKFPLPRGLQTVFGSKAGISKRWNEDVKSFHQSERSDHRLRRDQRQLGRGLPSSCGGSEPSRVIICSPELLPQDDQTIGYLISESPRFGDPGTRGILFLLINVLWMAEVGLQIRHWVADRISPFGEFIAAGFLKWENNIALITYHPATFGRMNWYFNSVANLSSFQSLKVTVLPEVHQVIADVYPWDMDLDMANPLSGTDRPRGRDSIVKANRKFDVVVMAERDPSIHLIPGMTLTMGLIRIRMDAPIGPKNRLRFHYSVFVADDLLVPPRRGQAQKRRLDAEPLPRRTRDQPGY